MRHVVEASNAPVVMGIDAGFSAIGWALVRIEPESETLLRMGVITTEKTDAKHNVFAADDNVRRGRYIANCLDALMRGARPSAICAEAMSFPRSSSVAAKMALCWGALLALAELRHLPLLQVSPQQLKIAVCGRKDASKQDVLRVVEKRFRTTYKVAFGGHVASCQLAGFTSRKSDTLLEHPIDASASVLACLDSDVIRAIRMAGRGPRPEG